MNQRIIVRCSWGVWVSVVTEINFLHLDFHQNCTVLEMFRTLPLRIIKCYLRKYSPPLRNRFPDSVPPKKSNLSPDLKKNIFWQRQWREDFLVNVTLKKEIERLISTQRTFRGPSFVFLYLFNHNWVLTLVNYSKGIF